MQRNKINGRAKLLNIEKSVIGGVHIRLGLIGHEFAYNMHFNITQ
jgi:hypothetical protein